MMDNVDSRKQAIRARVRQARRSLTPAEAALNEQGLTAELQALVAATGARSLSCYYPVKGEPHTLAFIHWAIQQGIRVLLPQSREDGLLDWIAWDGEATSLGLYGIPEPEGEPLSPLAANDLDLLLIPACAVDRTGMRLGWGRGFFDKTLGSMDRRPPVYAIVHEEEVLQQVPSTLLDQRVTGVVTPQRTFLTLPPSPAGHFPPAAV